VPLLARAPGDLVVAPADLMVALPSGQYMTIFAAAGFVGGFVYGCWLGGMRKTRWDRSPFV
jgi:hypothetical protein